MFCAIKFRGLMIPTKTFENRYLTTTKENRILTLYPAFATLKRALLFSVHTKAYRSLQYKQTIYLIKHYKSFD